MALVACGECSGQVSTLADKCPHCGAPVIAGFAPPQTPPKPSATTPQPSGSPLIGLLFFAVAVLVIYKVVRPAPKSDTQRATEEVEAATRNLERQAAAEAAAMPVLKLVSSSCTANSLGMVIVKGQVQNISNRPLERVRVSAGYYMADGKHVSSDSGFLDLTPLMPGQRSGFDVIGPRNPLVKKCGVEGFSEGFGDQLKWEGSD